MPGRWPRTPRQAHERSPRRCRARLLARAPCEFIEQCLINPETLRTIRVARRRARVLQARVRPRSRRSVLYPTLIYGAIKKSGKTTFGCHPGHHRAAAVRRSLRRGLLHRPTIWNRRAARVFEAIRRIVEASPCLPVKPTSPPTRSPSPPPARPSPPSVATTLRAGANPTIAVFDELWGFTSEKAWRLMGRIGPLAGDAISCRLVVTHAGFGGEIDTAGKTA